MGTSKPSICLFDWNSRSHHPVYAGAVAEALAPVAEVTLAAPDEMLEELSHLPVRHCSLGEPRAAAAESGGSRGELANQELTMFRSACDATGADHGFQLYADAALRWMLREQTMPAPVTIAVFQARAHYPSAYDTPLSVSDRLRGRYLERKVRRWRARPDAHALFGLDPVSVEIWGRQAGAPAYWLPEPRVPVPDELPAPSERRGCVLFGLISKRKGVELLADAVALAPTDLELVIAGQVAAEASEDVERSVERMRSAGASVALEAGYIERPEEAMQLIASARCAVLPYRTHFATSRVLAEAAAVGTPVVGTRWGFIGHTIREYGLGIAVDPFDAAELREAILRLSDDPETPSRYAAALRRYTEEKGGGKFGPAVRAAFGLEH